MTDEVVRGMRSTHCAMCGNANAQYPEVMMYNRKWPTIHLHSACSVMLAEELVRVFDLDRDHVMYTQFRTHKR